MRAPDPYVSFQRWARHYRKSLVDIAFLPTRLVRLRVLQGLGGKKLLEVEWIVDLIDRSLARRETVLKACCST
jgi:hypothetical protein